MQTEVVGKWYHRILAKINKIIKYQYTEKVKNGIKGFLFHGEPGTGKTAIAKEIGNYTARIFGNTTNPKDYIKYYQILDCSNLAHARYGETEAHIHKVFNDASNAKLQGILFQVLIFDDADGLFITRSYGSKLEAWYIGQINVFFHELDNLNTSETCVILTTNRLDLMDKAVKDRLYLIEFPEVPEDILCDKARNMGNELKFKPDALNNLIEEVKSNKDQFKTFRDIEKKVYDYYISEITGDDW